MRQPPADEVSAAARRRLELLQRELAAGGLPSATATTPPPWLDDEADATDAVAPPLVTGAPVAPSGRHSRRQVHVGEKVGGWAGGLAERVLPEALRGRVGLGVPHLAVVAVVVALGLVVAAVVALRSVGETAPVPTRSPVALGTTPSPSTGPSTGPSSGPSALVSAAGAAAAGTSTKEVVVDVAGKVRRPGVFSLPAGSRVVDAIRRAGGLRGHPPMAGLNRARVLVDGEQILVGVAAAPGVAASAAAAPGAATGGSLLNLNSATGEQLEGLPGVGPVTAEKILAWRSAHGAFSSVDELLEVDGIGEKTLAQLAPHLTL